jgi:cobalt-zinc-cadmium efflux system membrane fusion protein
MISGSAAKFAGALASLALFVALGCNRTPPDSAKEGPSAVTVQPDTDPALVQVLNPAAFPLVAATSYQAPTTLNATGTVNPDVSRTIPVISIASGRVVAIHARLGDSVKKGQLLMEVQSSDVSSAFSAYLKAVNDEHLALAQLDRARLLLDKGAIPASQLEIAQNAEDDTKAALTAAEQQLHVLGVDKDHPTETVKVYAPASGIIVTQNVTDAAAAGVNYSGSATAFTIADLSRVWVICDVYENDLAQVHLGQKAEIRLAAYPGKVLPGVINDIGALLDPSLHTAKVRIEVTNPDALLRVGMFTTATFFGSATQTHASVPATAILHLHDRDWVYVPVPPAAGVPASPASASFRRVAIEAGEMLPNGLQEVTSGIAIGQQVVSNALTLQNAVAP